MGIRLAHIRSVLALAIVAIVVLPSFAQTVETNPVAAATETPGPPTAVRDPLAVFSDNDSSLEDRVDAAEALLRSGRHSEIQGVLAEQTGAVAISAQALLRTELPLPDAFLPLCAAVLLQSEASVQTDIVARAMLRATDDRAVIRAVLFEAAQQPDIPISTAGCSLLVRLSGRDSFQKDFAQWHAWWEQSQWLPETEWRKRVCDAHADRAERLQNERDEMRENVLAMHGALLQQTPKEQRDAILAVMLTDGIVEVRLLAIDRINRALLNAEPMGANVDAALPVALADSNAEVRREAARVLLHKPSETAPIAAAQRLREETDAATVAFLLQLVSRSPQPESVGPALQWLDTIGPAQEPAAKALAAALDAGMLDATDLQKRILIALRSAENLRARPNAMQLLAMLGEEADLATLATIARDAHSEVLQNAARALARRQETIGVLLRLAQETPALVGPILARAIAQHEPTAAMLTALHQALSDDHAAQQEAILVVVIALPAEELLAVANATGSPAQRAVLLEAALTPQLTAAEPAFSSTMLEELGVLLAKALQKSGDTASSLEILEQTPVSSARIGERFRLLLELGGIELAKGIDANAEVWIDTIESLHKEASPHITKAVQACVDRFAEELSESQHDRLAVVQEALHDAAEATADNNVREDPKPLPTEAEKET